MPGRRGRWGEPLIRLPRSLRERRRDSAPQVGDGRVLHLHQVDPVNGHGQTEGVHQPARAVAASAWSGTGGAGRGWRRSIGAHSHALTCSVAGMKKHQAQRRLIGG